MIRPPNRLYSKNFTAARDRPGPPPKPPIRKYIGTSMASKNTYYFFTARATTEISTIDSMASVRAT